MVSEPTHQVGGKRTDSSCFHTFIFSEECTDTSVYTFSAVVVHTCTSQGYFFPKMHFHSWRQDLAGGSGLVISLSRVKICDGSVLEIVGLSTTFQ